MNQNDKERALYELREKSNKDRISALEDAEEKGEKKGIKKGRVKGALEEKLNTIKNGIENNIPLETLSVLTNLSVGEIKNILEEL